MALGAVAALAHSGAALAQADDRLTGMGAIQLQPASEAFSSRALSVVYATPVDLRGYGANVLPKRAGDDVDFAPGPAVNGSDGQGGPVIVSGAAWGIVGEPGTNLTTDTRFSFWDTFSGWTIGTFPGASLLGQRLFGGLVITPGYITFYDTASPASMLDFDTPVEVSTSEGTDCFVTIEALNPGETTLHSQNWVVTSGPALNVGGSDGRRWGDANGNNVVDSAELNSTTVVRRLYLGLQGEAPPPLPTISVDLGCLADGVVSANLGDTTPGSVRWLAFCANNPVEDSLFRYLDIDTVGTAQDTSIVLFDLGGNQIGAADSSRAGNGQGMISVGVGRRASTTGGAQYDGWAGDLTNQSGTRYFVGVLNESASAVNPGVNIRTNLNSAQNGPAVPPVTNGVAYGVLTPGTSLGLPQVLERDTVNSVRWSTFTLPQTVCSNSGSLTFDFVTQSAPIADVVAWVFNAQGDIVAFGDDGQGSSANKPDIRFGAGGNAGDLPAGPYYLAVALFDADNSDLSTVPGRDRFHVRGRAGSSLEAGANIFYQASTVCQTTWPTCGSVDFNGDGQIGDATDLDAFLSVYAEGPCIPATANCDFVDFNRDGSDYDPCDMESFLRVFSGGTCTLCGV